MTQHVLIPLPALGYEATEASVPWQVLTQAGVQVTFATPQGEPAVADMSTVSGEGLGWWRSMIFRAAGPSRAAYEAMVRSAEYAAPIRWDEAKAGDYDAIVVPGGHHHEMRPFLESEALQRLIVAFDDRDKLVAAICHGVLLVARSRGAEGGSVLQGRKVTTVPGDAENKVHQLCHAKMGNERFGKPYEITAEEEIRELLARPEDLVIEPMPLRKDGPRHTSRGLVVQDCHFLTARMPHDTWTFATRVVEALGAQVPRETTASRPAKPIHA